ncbi:MAG: hypothetical protein WAN87_05500 [Thermoplasmata archaeon]
MLNPLSSNLRIERAIYLVGGLAVLLWGFQSIVSSLLSIYNAVSPGPAPPASSHFWIDQSVTIFVQLIIVLAGLLLLSLAWRAHRLARASGHSDASRP